MSCVGQFRFTCDAHNFQYTLFYVCICIKHERAWCMCICRRMAHVPLWTRKFILSTIQMCVQGRGRDNPGRRFYYVWKFWKNIKCNGWWCVVLRTPYCVYWYAIVCILNPFLPHHGFVKCKLHQIRNIKCINYSTICIAVVNVFCFLRFFDSKCKKRDSLMALMVCNWTLWNNW